MGFKLPSKLSKRGRRFSRCGPGDSGVDIEGVVLWEDDDLRQRVRKETHSAMQATSIAARTKFSARSVILDIVHGGWTASHGWA